MSSPDTTKPHPYVKAHTQLVVSIYARGFAALGVIVFTPSFNSLTGIMFFALSTVLREGISYVARQSPAIVDELGYGSSLGSSMGLTLVWVLATVLRVRAKAATTWWLVTRIPHVQEKWKPLVDVFVIVEVMMDIGAACGLVFASIRGWQLRSSSRILAFIAGSLFMIIGVDLFTSTHELRDDEPKYVWLGSVALCAAMADASSWFTNRGIRVAVQRGWANPFLAIPAVNSLWILLARDRPLVDNMALRKEDEEVTLAGAEPSWR